MCISEITALQMAEDFLTVYHMAAAQQARNRPCVFKYFVCVCVLFTVKCHNALHTDSKCSVVVVVVEGLSLVVQRKGTARWVED